METVHKIYTDAGIITHRKLQNMTRASCYPGINERPSYFILLVSNSSQYDDTINLYEGQGTNGDQIMHKANARLDKTKKKIFMFIKYSVNKWKYVGMFKRNGKVIIDMNTGRKVFKFPLANISPLATTVEATPQCTVIAFLAAITLVFMSAQMGSLHMGQVPLSNQLEMHS
jgi:hypothetical protein